MEFKVLNKATKELKFLNTNDPALLAEVSKKLEFLEKREFLKLDIKSINRRNGKYKIQEIRIKYPSSYRVFFVEIIELNGCTYIVDCRPKKVDKFKDEYFKNLDRYLDAELPNK